MKVLTVSVVAALLAVIGWTGHATGTKYLAKREALVRESAREKVLLELTDQLRQECRNKGGVLRANGLTTWGDDGPSCLKLGGNIKVAGNGENVSYERDKCGWDGGWYEEVFAAGEPQRARCLRVIGVIELDGPRLPTTRLAAMGGQNVEVVKRGKGLVATIWTSRP